MHQLRTAVRPRRSRLVTALLAALLCATAGWPTDATAATTGHGAGGHRTHATAGPARPSGTPQWADPWAVPGPAVWFECRNTHRSRNDPIVFPGRPGAAHRHVFFGSRRSNAFSTVRSLLGGRSSCNDARDTTAYWFPEPRLRSGAPAEIWSRTRVYYQKAGLRRVRPIPRGLKMLAGDLDRGIVPGEAGFACRPRRNPGRSGMPIGGRRATRCPRGSNLGFTVVFPNCWDGRRLDSPDHRSHLRYARDRRCPSGWVPIPQVRISVSTFGGNWRGRFASGGPGTVHADVFVAPQPGLMRMVVGCLNGTRRCPRTSFGL